MWLYSYQPVVFGGETVYAVAGTDDLISRPLETQAVVHPGRDFYFAPYEYFQNCWPFGCAFKLAGLLGLEPRLGVSPVFLRGDFCYVGVLVRAVLRKKTQ